MRWLIAAVVVLSVAVLAVARGGEQPAASQQRTLEERIADLEYRVQILEQRLGPPSGSGGPSAPLSSTDPFVASGQANGQSANFSCAGSVQVCWEVSGESPSARIPGRASFYFYPEGPSGSSYRESLLGRETNDCTFITLPAGVYYIDVVATDWTVWRITVRPA